MSLLSKLVFLLFLASVFGPSYAAIESTDFTECKVFSDSDKKDGDKKEGEEEEEEPDCE